MTSWQSGGNVSRYLDEVIRVEPRLILVEAFHLHLQYELLVVLAEAPGRKPEGRRCELDRHGGSLRMHAHTMARRSRASLGGAANAATQTPHARAMRRRHTSSTNFAMLSEKSPGSSMLATMCAIDR